MTNFASQNSHSRLLSVGHSNHEWKQFLDLLRGAGITALADVRSSPFSKRWPHFNKPQLAEELDRQDIVYIFLGHLLGGRPKPLQLYDSTGQVDYERVRATDFFREGLERLKKGMEEFTIAMMCSEADPLDCHRGLMITPALMEQGIAPGHLTPEGDIETTWDMEQRLLKETGHQDMIEGLFADTWSEEERQQALAEAYRIMARKKAYRLAREEWPTGDNDSPGDLEKNEND